MSEILVDRNELLNRLKIIKSLNRRYIQVDEAITYVENMGYWGVDFANKKLTQNKMLNCAKVFNELMGEEVIKCKDCKYCITERYTKSGAHIPTFCFLHSTAQNTVLVSEDDYCSKAERRTE